MAPASLLCSWTLLASACVFLLLSGDHKRHLLPPVVRLMGMCSVIIVALTTQWARRGLSVSLRHCFCCAFQLPTVGFPLFLKSSVSAPLHLLPSPPSQTSGPCRSPSLRGLSPPSCILELVGVSCSLGLFLNVVHEFPLFLSSFSVFVGIEGD